MTKNVKSRIWKGSLAMMFAMLMLVTCIARRRDGSFVLLSSAYSLNGSFADSCQPGQLPDGNR